MTLMNCLSPLSVFSVRNFFCGRYCCGSLIKIFKNWKTNCSCSL